VEHQVLSTNSLKSSQHSYCGGHLDTSQTRYFFSFSNSHEAMISNRLSQGLMLFQEKRLTLIIPLVLVALLYTKFIPKLEYLSRIALAFPIGLGAGIILRSTISGQLFSQVAATMLPLNSVSNIIIVVGTFCVTYYFLFTVKPRKNTEAIGKTGIYLMMVTFGLSFATSVAANTATYLGFLQNIFGTWLGIIK